MATKNIKKILLNKDGDNFVADIENIENRITQNSSNLETAKQELSNKCDTVLSDAKAYTDTEKAKLFNSTNGTFTGPEYFRDVNNSVLRFNGGNTHDGGASLMLYGKDSTTSHGGFDLVACTKEDSSDAKQFVGRPDGSLTWNGKNIVRSVNGVDADTNGNVQLGNSGAIGEIKWFAFNTPPEGYLVCNGANVSRTTYADLFAVIGTTFGKGDGSTTFSIPDLRDRYIIGANTNTLGTYITEQLPNIKGMFQIRQTAISNGTGLSETIVANSGLCSTQIISLNSGMYPLAGSTANRQQVDFNAHNSNSVYTDSGKVYPLSLALLPCIKY